MPDYSPRKGMSEKDIASTIDAILAEQSLEEKVAMMSGSGFFKAMIEDRMRWSARPYRAGAGCDRLGVPALYFSDGPRGVARGESTCFPVTMARGASWDRELERRVGEVIGIETRAQGCNLSGAVCVNILRHPGWGRAQETYGEDSYHVGEMGAALSGGIQKHNVIATVKHFAANSLENMRFTLDVRVDERTLREVYLPHFKRIIDAGCASVMSAYNKVNGVYCGHHRQLLTEILREDWGFEGFVHSDWIMGVFGPDGAVAGLDIENPEPMHYGEKLVKAVRSGEIDPAVVDTACRRVLTVLYRFMAAEDPLESYDAEKLVACDAHIALAREVAEKSAVLLTNKGALPLARDARLGLFGRMAARAITGDNGSSKVHARYVVTPQQGLSAYLGHDLALSGDEADPEQAARAAADMDVAVVVVGTTAADEGEYIPGDLGAAPALPPVIAEAMAAAYEKVKNEDGDDKDTGAMGSGKDRGGDRTSLRLAPDQVALIKAVSDANPNTVVVIVSGSAILSSEWSDGVAAILQTFYSGMEGGHALARLLFGDVSPTGKLPFTVAANEGDNPFFDIKAETIDYGPLHGYALFANDGKQPQFAFGHGLSYTSFSYGDVTAEARDGGIAARVMVSNTGGREASEVAQLYVAFPGTAVTRPPFLLRGFERVHLRPGESACVEFFVPQSDLAYWDSERRDWRTERGVHTVLVGPSSRAADLQCVEIPL
ncbi:beta-glucosidase family protein [Kordiimonas sp.]|uniref:beta-glucosidase family protein n=1 Tax=Kordiimonas sp. TaxID=1970157 RepID=UPI003A91EAD8